MGRMEEHYKNMEALEHDLKDVVKYIDEREELSDGELSDLENMEGMMQDIIFLADPDNFIPLATKIDSLAQQVSILASPEYCEIRGIMRGTLGRPLF